MRLGAGPGVDTMPRNRPAIHSSISRIGRVGASSDLVACAGVVVRHSHHQRFASVPPDGCAVPEHVLVVVRHWPAGSTRLLPDGACGLSHPVSYTHLTLPT